MLREGSVRGRECEGKGVLGKGNVRGSDSRGNLG